MAFSMNTIVLPFQLLQNTSTFREGFKSFHAALNREISRVFRIMRHPSVQGHAHVVIFDYSDQLVGIVQFARIFWYQAFSRAAHLSIPNKS